jgi:hypothetical protein
VDLLAKQAAELALRLASLPAEAWRKDVQALDDIEQLAARILKEIASVRASAARPIGETNGVWRAMQPTRRQ